MGALIEGFLSRIDGVRRSCGFSVSAEAIAADPLLAIAQNRIERRTSSFKAEK